MTYSPSPKVFLPLYNLSLLFICHWSAFCHCLHFLEFYINGIIMYYILKFEFFTQHNQTDPSCVFIFFNYFIVVQLQLSAFSLHPSTPPQLKPPSLLCFHPPPLLCPCVLYSSWEPFFPQSLPPSPLAIVRLFLTSMSVVIFYLLFSFVDYVPLKGEIIWYLSLNNWLISLSIMLSSFIHAVAKGRSSFFLSAV